MCSQYILKKIYGAYTVEAAPREQAHSPGVIFRKGNMSKIVISVMLDQGVRRAAESEQKAWKL